MSYKNIEEGIRKRKEYYNTHKEEIKIKAAKRYALNKEESNLYSKQYRLDNLQRLRKYDHERKIKSYYDSVDYINKLLGSSKCCHCGDNNPIHLVFHHTNPLEKDNSVANFKHWGINKIKKEIEKCIILCDNCHRKLHYSLVSHSNIMSKAQVYATEYKVRVGCAKCGIHERECLAFHHLNSEDKYLPVARINHFEKVKIEIEKCIVLCGNCHREVTREELNSKKALK